MPDWAEFFMGDDSVAKQNSDQQISDQMSISESNDAAEADGAGTDGAGTDAAENSKAQPAKAPTSIWRCVSGSAIAAVLGYGAYNLTFKIATQFATHPLVSDNYIAIRLSGMIRTLVVGIASMATGIFAFAALGLAVLGLQITLQKLKPGSSASS